MRPSATASTTVAAPIRTSPVPKTPAGRLERDRVGLEALVLRGLDALEPGPIQPVEVRALADGQQDPVAGDDELGPGSGLRAAPAGRVGLAGAHPDELDAGDVAGLVVGDDAVGPAWKIAWTPSSIASWTSLAAGMSFMSRR